MNKELQQSEAAVAAPIAAPFGQQIAADGCVCHVTGKLQHLIAAWPTLSDDIQNAILAIVGLGGVRKKS